MATFLEGMLGDLGGALGLVAFVWIAVFLLWFFLCRRKNEPQQATSQPQNATQRVTDPRQNVTQQARIPQQNVTQQARSPHQNTVQRVTNPHQNVTQQARSPHQNTAQRVTNPQQNVTQQARSPQQNTAQRVTNPRQNVTQQARSPQQNTAQRVTNPNQNVTQQARSPHQNTAQRVTNPHQNVARTAETAPSNPAIRAETCGRAESSSRGGGIKIFQTEELYSATGNFSRENCIGEGKFGRVYKGMLQDGTRIAIKKRTGPRTREFFIEARYLSSIRHENIAILLGWCQGRHRQFLVYEYVPCGSVSSHLFMDAEKISHQMLDFKQRLTIAIGAAKGLTHLHTSTHRLTHRNFKTANVLVDASFKVKVADAGIHIFLGGHYLAPGPYSRVTKDADADAVFFAPEVIKSSHFSFETDVYSFGVFLLELVSGRQAKEPPFPHSPLNLVEWVRQNEGSDEITSIVDEKMEGRFTEEGMVGCLELAVQCVNPTNDARPVMGKVVEELERILKHEIKLAISDASPVFIRGGKPVSNRTMNTPVVPHSM